MKLFICFLKEMAEILLRRFKLLSVPSELKRNMHNELIALKSDGFFSVNDYLSKEECQSFINDIDACIEDDNVNVWSDECGADNRVYFINTINEKFKKFYETPYFRDVLRAYTGIKDPKGMLLAGRIEEAKGNLGSGGGWHRDSPVFHQMKAICYLSDVKGENGPFQYVEKSHGNLDVMVSYLRRFFSPGQYRFSNSDIDFYCDHRKRNVKSVIADAGSLFFADTKGIHRGMPIKQGVRYVLFAYYWDNEIPNHFDKLRQDKAMFQKGSH